MPISDHWQKTMDIRQLEYFMDIVQAGGFNRAANRKNISQSALSRQIKQLEDELGTTIFERHARGVKLTEAGELLSSRVQYLLRQIGNMRGEIIERSKVPTGELSFGIPSSMRTLLAEPSVANFVNRYPHVFMRYVEGSSGVVRDQILQGRIDIGLISAMETSSLLESTPFVREQMYLAGPVEAGLEIDRPIPVEKVLEADLILASPQLSLRIALDKKLQGYGGVKNVRVEVNSNLALSLVSQMKTMRTVYSACGINGFIKAGTISAAPIEDFEITWTISTLRERPLSMAVRLFRDIMVEQARTYIRDGTWPGARILL